MPKDPIVPTPKDTARSWPLRFYLYALFGLIFLGHFLLTILYLSPLSLGRVNSVYIGKYFPQSWAVFSHLAPLRENMGMSIQCFSKTHESPWLNLSEDLWKKKQRFIFSQHTWPPKLLDVTFLRMHSIYSLQKSETVPQDDNYFKWFEGYFSWFEDTYYYKNHHRDNISKLAKPLCDKHGSFETINVRYWIKPIRPFEQRYQKALPPLIVYEGKPLSL